MNGFRKIFPIFLSHCATFFAKVAERKVVPFDEFYYQLKLMHLFQKDPVCKNILEGFINQLHPNERRIGYFQQDEATAYTVRATLNYLSKYIL
jgi:hypothetical protein